MSIPVSSTATVTPFPVKGDVDAPTALMPHATSALGRSRRDVSGGGNGLDQVSGIGSAAPKTLSSRPVHEPHSRKILNDRFDFREISRRYVYAFCPY